jgi:hypothetical protein
MARPEGWPETSQTVSYLPSTGEGKRNTRREKKSDT